VSTFTAMRQGLRRALRSPFILLWLWLLNAVVALPAAVWIAGSLHESIGESRVAENLRTGFDLQWYGEYKAQAAAVETSFSPTVNRAGAFLDNLEGWLSGRLFTNVPELVVLGAIYALLWALMLGGVLARYTAPDDNRGAGAFFRNGGRFFFRFFRLAVLAAASYAAIYLAQHHWSERLVETTRDITAELGVLGRYLTVWVPVALLLVLVRVIFDYAKIATVVDDRRSMLLAALRGAGFVVLHPLRTLGLCFAWLVVGALVLTVYAFVAPGASVATPATVAIAFAIGQAFLMSRLLIRLSLLAGETELYRAHSAPPADYSNSSVTPIASR
jgi:hypothetical protein